VIFGGWHPVKVALGALLFAFLQVAGIPLQDVWPGVPTQVIQMAPFPLMILALALVHGLRSEPVQRWAADDPRRRRWLHALTAGAPRSLGKAWER